MLGKTPVQKRSVFSNKYCSLMPVEPAHDTGWRRLSLVISSLVVSRVTHGDEDDEEVIGG